MAYGTNPTKFKIADTTNGGDLLLERESRIKTGTYVANCIGKFDVRTLQIYRRGTESEFRTVFVAIKIISVLSLFNCS